VAKRLGNTTAVCRKCYIHPVIMESYLEGVTVRRIRTEAGSVLHDAAGLSAEEAAVLALLERRLPTTADRLEASLKVVASKRRRRMPHRR